MHARAVKMIADGLWGGVVWYSMVCLSKAILRPPNEVFEWPNCRWKSFMEGRHLEKYDKIGRNARFLLDYNQR